VSGRTPTRSSVNPAALVLAALFATGIDAAAAVAAPAVSCGGAAMQGGAQLVCSHVDPKAPPQLCTFSWALTTDANVTETVGGSFLIPPGAANLQVYQGAGFVSAATPPIVMCQGRKARR
jgi:hypothetical protein